MILFYFTVMRKIDNNFVINRIKVHVGQPPLGDNVVEGQGHVDNACGPPIESLPVVHTLTQEAVKAGKASGLGLGGRHLGPDGRNFFFGLDARDVMEVSSHDVQDPLTDSTAAIRPLWCP